jgi:hypothetical protein
MVPLSARLTLLLNPGSLATTAAEVVRGQARGSADDGVLHRPQGGGSGRYPDLHLRTDVPERY